MPRRIAGFVLALALFPAAAFARPAMWTVRDADSEIVLFGSVHILPPGLDWRPPALTAALARADDVWFEIPFDGPAQQRFAILAQQQGVLPPGQSLSPRLTLAGRVRLARVCKALGVEPLEIERLKPWLAEIRLTLAALARDKVTSSEGVEEAIAAAAPASARREAFETPEEQLALFAGMSEKEQVLSLENTLKEIENDPQAYARLLKAWMSGDPRVLEREALNPVRRASPALYRRLVAERNARWIEVLKTRMAGSGRTVVVVGAGHLAGPDGLPTRLRALGFQVEGP